MNVDVYVMVHNDITILPYFLRHYETFAQRIFAFEDQSTDGSREMLEAHSKVQILPVEVHGINEAYWTGTLWPRYEELSRGQADYVMCVDCDEFVYNPELVAVLKKEKARGTQLLYCKGFTMIAEELPTTVGQIYEEIRLGLPDFWSFKGCVFDPAIYLRFHAGRHRIKKMQEGVSRRSRSGLRLLHYRYLGEQYFADKVARNLRRQGVALNLEGPAVLKKQNNLPDLTVGDLFGWYKEHKAEAVDVILIKVYDA